MFLVTWVMHLAPQPILSDKLTGSDRACLSKSRYFPNTMAVTRAVGHGRESVCQYPVTHCGAVAGTDSVPCLCSKDRARAGVPSGIPWGSAAVSDCLAGWPLARSHASRSSPSPPAAEPLESQRLTLRLSLPPTSRVGQSRVASQSRVSGMWLVQCVQALLRIASSWGCFCGRRYWPCKELGARKTGTLLLAEGWGTWFCLMNLLTTVKLLTTDGHLSDLFPQWLHDRTGTLLLSSATNEDFTTEMKHTWG